MAKKLYSKTNIDFITKIMGVFGSFRHKGKPYLTYFQSRERNDEFLMRDNLVKPLFQAIGYDQQQDFSPEETIVSGGIDTTIRNGYNHPIIVIETQSSLLKDLTEHRNRLFIYTEEIGARFAVLSDGVRFEAWECPGRGRVRFLRVSLNFQELYSKFLKKGTEGLSEPDAEKVLKLKFLAKELLFVREEELYKEPELHVSDATVFSQLIDDLQDAMEMVKSDILSQFEIRQGEWQEYQDLIAKAETLRVYPSEFKKYEPAKHTTESYNDWKKVSPGANSSSQELFCAETMYILFNRLLLIRICEDKGLTPRQISNGGIKTWLSWKGFMEFKKANYAQLLREAYDTMNLVYPHMFRHGIFDWYLPDSDIILRILFIFNRYNFKNVDRDVLGKLYERYIDKEERKRLGQFYTPEEIIDYILEAVGYTPENEIEGKKLLDPACGSGGFLVRAVKAIVERYQRRNVSPEVILERVCDSIYGFDINPFAAHLAEMNLLFQVIDLINEAKKANPEFDMEKFNIFATNSLRIPKGEEQGQLPLDWEQASEYMEEAEIVKQIKLKQGDFSEGFDFVVGNPPYVRNRALSTKDKDYYTKEYPEYAFKKFDIYVLFIGHGVKLLRDGGKFGFIVSNKFAVSDYGLRLREFILNHCAIEQLVDVSQVQLFKEASPYPCLLVLRKELDLVRRRENKVKTVIGIQSENDLAEHRFQVSFMAQKMLEEIDQKLFVLEYTENKQELMEKIKTDTVSLGSICNVNEGIHTGNVRSKLLYLNKVNDKCKKLLGGGDLRRYGFEWNGMWIQYDKKLMEKMKGEYGSLRDERIFNCSEKLIVRDISRTLLASYDDRQHYLLNTLYSIRLKDASYNLKFLLGVLCSKLIDSYFRAFFQSTHISGNYLRFKPVYLKQLPIKQANAEQQQDIIKLVDQMLQLNKKLPELEKLASNLPELIKVDNIQTKGIADCPDATLVMEKEVTAKPNIERKQRKVYIDRKSYVECTDDNLAKYLELYVNSIKDGLRGRTKTDLHRLLQAPTAAEGVKAILAKREALLKEIEDLKQRCIDIDRHIDQKVYQLYGLTDKEIELVKEVY